MYLLYCRVVCHHLKMLLQSLRVLCLAPGRLRSIWQYWEVLGRLTIGSWRLACGFWTDIHFADVKVHTMDTLSVEYCCPWSIASWNCTLLEVDWVCGAPRQCPGVGNQYLSGGILPVPLGDNTYSSWKQFDCFWTGYRQLSLDILSQKADNDVVGPYRPLY